MGDKPSDFVNRYEHIGMLIDDTQTQLNAARHKRNSLSRHIVIDVFITMAGSFASGLCIASDRPLFALATGALSLYAGLTTLWDVIAYSDKRVYLCQLETQLENLQSDEKYKNTKKLYDQMYTKQPLL